MISVTTTAMSLVSNRSSALLMSVASKHSYPRASKATRSDSCNHGSSSTRRIVFIHESRKRQNQPEGRFPTFRPYCNRPLVQSQHAFRQVQTNSRPPRYLLPRHRSSESTLEQTL